MLTAVHVPTSVSEAVAHLDRGGTVMGGGTVLMPLLTTQASPPTEVVSLRRAGLAGVTREGDEAVVGTATTLGALARDEQVAFLSEAVRTIASPPVRNLATVGGNLFAKAPYGDLATCLLALDARVDIAGSEGERVAPVAEVVADGVAAGEVATAVRFAVPAAGTWRYRKAMRRRYNSAAIVTVAAVVETDGERVSSARIALGGVAARPLRASSAEAALLGQPFAREAVEAAAAAAVADADPFDDPYASAWYRARVLPVHVRRALLGE